MQSLLICKSFCKTSNLTTKQRDLRHLVGDTMGIMPVLLCKSFCKTSDLTTTQRGLHCWGGDITGIMPVGL